MKQITYTEQVTKPKLVIKYDEDPQSPREWSNLGYFITVDRNHYSPDKHEDLISLIQSASEESNNQEEHIKNIKERMNDTYGKVLAIYPIVKYEHSGVSYSLGTTKGFDYSNNGFYIITEKTQKEMGIEQKDFEKVINEELSVYNKWANGEVYGFTLYKDNGEVDESCWGFYDIEDIRESLSEEWSKEDLTEYLVA